MTEEEKAREGEGGWIFPSEFPGVAQKLTGCNLLRLCVEFQAVANVLNKDLKRLGSSVAWLEGGRSSFYMHFLYLVVLLRKHM